MSYFQSVQKTATEIWKGSYFIVYALYFFCSPCYFGTIGTLACNYQFSACSSWSMYFTDVLFFFLSNFHMCAYIHTYIKSTCIFLGFCWVSLVPFQAFKCFATGISWNTEEWTCRFVNKAPSLKWWVMTKSTEGKDVAREGLLIRSGSADTGYVWHSMTDFHERCYNNTAIQF